MTDLDRTAALIPAVRLRRIQELIELHGSLSLRDAQLELNVSEMTVRRDFANLEQLGVVERTWGGIVARRALMQELDHDQRQRNQAEAKQVIAALANECISDGDTVFVSGGTTALVLARQLAGRSRLTIITTSLPALVALVDNPALVVIAIGGRTSPYNNDTSGPQAERAIAEFRADKAVIGATGISADGVFNANLERASIDRLMVEHAHETLVVSDHTKFGVDALTRVTPLLPTMTLVTDEAPAQHLRTGIEEAGVRIVAPANAGAPSQSRRRPRPTSA